MTYGSTTNCKAAGGSTRTEYQCRLGYEVTNQYITDGVGYSTITLQLEVRSISSSYYTYGYKQTTTIDGTALSAASFDMRDTNTWQVFGTRSITVTHDSNGNYSVSKSGSFTTTATGTYSLKSGSATVTVAPAQIQLTQGYVMVKDTSGVARRCPYVRVKDTSGVVHNIKYIMMKDVNGTVHQIKLA